MSLNAHKKRILLICNGELHQTTGIIFQNIQRKLSTAHDVQLITRKLPRPIWKKLPALIHKEFSSIKKVARADTVIAHSSLALCIFSLMAAKLLRRKIILFVWDFYPESFPESGIKMNKIIFSLYLLTERLAYRLADHLLVPSLDYVNYPAIAGLRTVRIMPIWNNQDPASIVGIPQIGSQLRIVFAGQINAIRSLGKSIAPLLRDQDRQIILEVFSKNNLPQDILEMADTHDNLTIVAHGFVDQDTLIMRLAEMDFGLIPISHDFNLPAFPSKSLTYLSAGIPILYDGPKMAAMEELCGTFSLGLNVAELASYDREQTFIWRQNFLARRDSYFENLEKKWLEFVNIL